MEFGGFLDYSKYKILNQIPDEFKPKTQFIPDKKRLETLPGFPFIVKPDLGERGVNVEVIRDKNEWEKYPLEKDLIIQEFIDLPFEFGVFYVKFPESSGQILSITGKEFLEFESDGNSTLRNFVENNIRAYPRKDYLFQKFKDLLDTIYPKGTKILLEPIGNHNRGTMFYDASNLISNDLILKLDEISEQIDGFNYGRFDVKTSSEEDLKKGNFIILEINGANSEATHIYDPNYNLIRAYREVKRHLDFQFQIAKMNPKKYSDFEFYKAVLKRMK